MIELWAPCIVCLQPGLELEEVKKIMQDFFSENELTEVAMAELGQVLFAEAEDPTYYTEFTH